jgi:HEAT repeat protein
MSIYSTQTRKSSQISQINKLPVVLRLIADPHEEIYLREVLIGDLALWGERIPEAFLLALLDDPELCAAALDMWRSQPAQTIPLERILPYCAHEEKYLREAAIKALLAAERLCPPSPILAALDDPESEVRTAASFGCISLMKWFGNQIPVEPLLSALHDEYPPVRENILDALGKISLRIPVEPVAAALTDATYYVRCAALETLGRMFERVPSSLYLVLQELSGSDPVPQVRLRATRALLLLSGMTPAPLKIPIIDLTLEGIDEELGE